MDDYISAPARSFRSQLPYSDHYRPWRSHVVLHIARSVLILLLTMASLFSYPALFHRWDQHLNSHDINYTLPSCRGQADPSTQTECANNSNSLRGSFEGVMNTFPKTGCPVVEIVAIAQKIRLPAHQTFALIEIPIHKIFRIPKSKEGSCHVVLPLEKLDRRISRSSVRMHDLESESPCPIVCGRFRGIIETYWITYVPFHLVSSSLDNSSVRVGSDDKLHKFRRRADLCLEFIVQGHIIRGTFATAIKPLCTNTSILLNYKILT